MAQQRISRRQLQGYLDKLSREDPVPEPKLRQAASQFGLDLEALLAGAERQHVRRDLVTYRDLDLLSPEGRSARVIKTTL